MLEQGAEGVRQQVLRGKLNAFKRKESLDRGGESATEDAGVSDADKAWAGKVIATTGQILWLEREEQLDAVTAISGSGPAYMFYFMEAMTDAGAEMGLTREQAYQLAVATFIGAGELARASTEPPEVLRSRVTSKGGTTYAAITAMDESGIKALFAKALHAARDRAREMGDEFGKA